MVERIQQLASHIFSIQTSCDSRIRRTLDDGPSIGEKCQLVGVVPKLQDEVVVADHAMGLEAAVHLDEVDGALALMDLHGIPAA